MYHINGTKDKNQMIISIDAEKVFDKIQHEFMIKTPYKLQLKGKLLDLIKGTSKIPLNKERMDVCC